MCVCVCVCVCVGGTRGLTVIVIGSGLGYSSSIPLRGYLHFT